MKKVSPSQVRELLCIRDNDENSLSEPSEYALGQNDVRYFKKNPANGGPYQRGLELLRTEVRGRLGLDGSGSGGKKVCKEVYDAMVSSKGVSFFLEDLNGRRAEMSEEVVLQKIRNMFAKERSELKRTRKSKKGPVEEKPQTEDQIVLWRRCGTSLWKNRRRKNRIGRRMPAV